MKANKITYWVSTAIIALMMLYSAAMYLTKPEMKQGFVHLGFPDYFRIELATLKILGAVLLIVLFRAVLKNGLIRALPSLLFLPLLHIQRLATRWPTA